MFYAAINIGAHLSSMSDGLCGERSFWITLDIRTMRRALMYTSSMLQSEGNLAGCGFNEVGGSLCRSERERSRYTAKGSMRFFPSKKMSSIPRFDCEAKMSSEWKLLFVVRGEIYMQCFLYIYCMNIHLVYNLLYRARLYLFFFTFRCVLESTVTSLELTFSYLFALMTSSLWAKLYQLPLRRRHVVCHPFETKVTVRGKQTNTNPALSPRNRIPTSSIPLLTAASKYSSAIKPLLSVRRR